MSSRVVAVKSLKANPTIFGERRLPVRLPVRIEGVDIFERPFTQFTYTLNVSHHGACLVDLMFPLRTGDIVHITHQERTATFRVAWSTQLPQRQIGVSALDPANDIWGVDFNQASEQSDRSDRRALRRFRCHGSAAVWQSGTKYSVEAKVSEMSEGGCYLEMATPPPVGTDLSVLLKVNGAMVCASATVRHSTPGVGMGVRFDSICTEELACLRGVLDRLAQIEAQINMADPEQKLDQFTSFYITEKGHLIPLSDSTITDWEFRPERHSRPM